MQLYESQYNYTFKHDSFNLQRKLVILGTSILGGKDASD